MSWYQTRQSMAKQIHLHGSLKKACEATGTNLRTAQRWASRFGGVPSLVGSNAQHASHSDHTQNASASEIEFDASDLPWNEHDLLARIGVDHDEYVITDVNPNAWQSATKDGDTVDLYGLRVKARRRMDSLLGIHLPEGWKPPSPPKHVANSDKPIHIPLFGDPHFPMHEPALYEASLAWLKKFKPPKWVCVGDEGDWSPFKRHKANRRTDVNVGQALIGTFNGLSGWAALAPGELIPGNHTKWLEDRVAERMGDMLDFIRPGDEYPYISMNMILKLPELGIKYFDTRGEYHDVVIEIADGLVALHGVKTGKHGGAIKEQDGWEGTSVVQGHDHSLQLTAVSKRKAGGHTQRYAISAGAMSLRDLGYSSTQDVDQGFAVITIWPDGSWHPDFALFNPETGVTTWRDWRYVPS